MHRPSDDVRRQPSPSPTGNMPRSTLRETATS
jgi:hypothetical protein